jgi:Ca-activated chloride channel family protein
VIHRLDRSTRIRHERRAGSHDATTIVNFFPGLSSKPFRPRRVETAAMTLLPFRAPLRLFLAVLFLVLPSCTPAASPPAAHDPGAVTVEGALGSPILLANGDSTVYARIRLGTAARPERPRGPVNLALAIDTSGSMEGEAIVEARNASQQMIDALKDGDRLAVVVFHSKAEVLLPSTELDAEVRADVRKKVAAIEARGTTEMAGGLQVALDQVYTNFNAKGVNRIVLLGDGIPNNPASIDSSARRAGELGIAVTTLGLGLDYDETLMGKIAELSGGRYKYIESASKLAVFFREEMQRIDTVYGRHASAVITPGPGVKIESVVGAETPSPGSPAHMSLGDITRGDSRDIIVRMTVTPRKAGVPIELLDTVISFDDALENAGRLERRVYLGAHTTLDEAAVAKAKNADVELSAAVAEASATTIRALELSKQGQNVRARELLTKGSAAALAQAKRTPSAALEKHANDMIAVAKDMPEVDAAQARQDAESSGYEFSDDAMQATPTKSPAPSLSPAAARRQKEVHQRSYEMTH